MKKSILTFLSLAAVSFIVACGNNTPKEDDHEGHDHAAAEVETEAAPQMEAQVNDPVLNAVYQEYVKLNQALVESDSESAEIVANTLELGAKDLANGNAIATTATKIIDASTIKEKREAFSELSNALIPLIKASGLKSGELYVDYCPMALNDKGAYWLSAKKGIKNPYFGDSMLTCGETKETII